MAPKSEETLFDCFSGQHVDQVDCTTSADPLARPTSSSLAEDVVPTLRLCQLVSWPSHRGYGFDVVTNNRGLCPASTGTGSGSTSGRRYGHFVGKVQLCSSFVVCTYTKYLECCNHLMPMLKPQSNGPFYYNAVIGTLAVDGWAVTFGTPGRGLGGLRPRLVPSLLYQM